MNHLMQTAIAAGLMFSGFALFALFYYLRTNTWNGYANPVKLIVAAAIMIIMSILLVNVEGIADLLKVATGLDVSMENSKIGFVTTGLALSGILTSKLKPGDQRAG